MATPLLEEDNFTLWIGNWSVIDSTIEGSESQWLSSLPKLQYVIAVVDMIKYCGKINGRIVYGNPFALKSEF